MPPTTKKTGTAAKKAVSSAPTVEEPKVADPADITNDPYAPTAWGSDGDTAGLVDLEVPSGQLCLVKRPGMEGLLRAGILRDMDTLTSIVNDKITKKTAKGQPAPQVEMDMNVILNDPKKLDAVMHTVDRAIVECVIKPTIHMTPDDPTRRKGGVIYADMVDLTDKMFIFQFVVGGSKDLESFRLELGAAMGSLDDQSAAEGEAQ